MRVILGVSGASGAALSVAAAGHLRALGASIDLVVSAAAERTLATECGPDALAQLTALCDRNHNLRDVGATIASGSSPVAGMLVAPCSMRSLAAISMGLDAYPRGERAVEGAPAAGSAGAGNTLDAGPSAQHDGGDGNGRHRHATGAGILYVSPDN
mgnify:CR=1 FL=1